MQLIDPRYRQKHFAALDGLRGVAALFVVGLHDLSPFGQDNVIPHARLAVDFFFLLSGFVIAYAYEERLGTTLSFGRFVKIRLIRLYPLLLLGLLFGFSVFIFKTVVIEHGGFDWRMAAALAGSLLMLPTHLITADGWSSIYPFNTPAWSLCFELFINLCYAAFLPRLSQRALNLILILSGVAVLAQAYHLGSVKGGDQWGDFIFGFGRVSFPFFCGVFLYRQRDRLPNRSPPFFVIALLLAAAFVMPVPAPFVWLFESLAVLALFPILVAWGSKCRPSAAGASVALFLGELSYPLYMLHYPLVRLFSTLERRLAHSDLQFYAFAGVEIASQILFACVMMKAYDEPVRRWLKRKYDSRDATAA